MTRPKLLLADDSLTIRNVVEQTFVDEGFDVMTATNGEEAMAKFAVLQPDIVILDVDMPEPNGYNICEMIKQDESTRHIPVLLIVGSFEPFDQNEAERVGADGFLTKPFQSIPDLIVRVEELIGPRERSAGPDETADIDNLYDRSFSEDDVVDEHPVEMFLGDAGMDDEIIETSYPSREATLDDEIIVISKVGTDLGEAFEPQAINNGKADAAENCAASQSLDLQDYEGLSEEFIDLVARRVVEKLSDKAIREIAKEEVPRIAEKLIREALEEKNN